LVPFPLIALPTATQARGESVNYKFVAKSSNRKSVATFSVKHLLLPPKGANWESIFYQI